MSSKIKIKFKDNCMKRIFFKNKKLKNNFLWTKSFNDNYNNTGYAIEVDSDNNIISICNFNNNSKSNFNTIKYDKDGNEIFRNLFEGEEQASAHDLVIDSKNNIIITGFEGRWNDDPFPDACAFILKYNEDGDFLWKKTFKKGICTIGLCVVVDSKDNIYFSSTFYKKGTPNLGCLTYKCDNKGNLIWNKSYHEHYLDIPYSLSVDSENNLIIVGYSYTPYKSKKDWRGGFLTLKYSKDGELSWAKRLEALKQTKAYDVAIDSQNNYIIVGEIEENSKKDIQIIKIDSNGNISWKKQFSYLISNVAYAINTDSKDSVILGVTSYSHKKTKNIILSFDKNGVLKWVKEFGENMIIFDLSIDSENFLISTGTKIGEVDNFFISKFS